MTLANTPPLRKYYYVRARQFFEELESGRVRVTDADGRTGIFSWDGHYLEGDLSVANEHMLVYVGGPTVPKVCNYRWTEIDADVNRPSGWPEALEEAVAHQLGRR